MLAAVLALLLTADPGADPHWLAVLTARTPPVGFGVLVGGTGEWLRAEVAGELFDGGNCDHSPSSSARAAVGFHVPFVRGHDPGEPTVARLAFLGGYRVSWIHPCGESVVRVGAGTAELASEAGWRVGRGAFGIRLGVWTEVYQAAPPFRGFATQLDFGALLFGLELSIGVML